MQNRQKSNIAGYMIGLLFSILLIAADQITKLAAIEYLKDQKAVPVIEGVFELKYLENRGSAFGMFQGKQVFLIVVTSLILLGLLYIYCFRIPHERRFRALNMIAVLYFAGAIGNFIDRIARNYVVDFFYFSLIDFPIFNMADIYVVLASFLLLILGLFYYKESDFERILQKNNKDS